MNELPSQPPPVVLPSAMRMGVIVAVNGATETDDDGNPAGTGTAITYDIAVELPDTGGVVTFAAITPHQFRPTSKIVPAKVNTPALVYFFSDSIRFSVFESPAFKTCT